jgi:hypothetical protein
MVVVPKDIEISDFLLVSHIVVGWNVVQQYYWKEIRAQDIVGEKMWNLGNYAMN